MILIPKNIYSTIAKSFPKLHTTLKRANIKETPEAFVQKRIQFALVGSVGLTVFAFFILAKLGQNLLLLLPMFFIILFGMAAFLMGTPNVMIAKRAREIDREVLFAGRYLLVKLESGTPLFNALIDASHSYGISSKYFKEIVDDVNLGIPIENALEKAREYSPSEHFKMILSELVTTLKTGADVSDSLRVVLNLITKNQLIEIKGYSKKLNAYVMLYMVIAAVLPSLGMTLFTVLASFINIPISNTLILVVVLVISLSQIIFLNMLQSIRPTVNI